MGGRTLFPQGHAGQPPASFLLMQVLRSPEAALGRGSLRAGLYHRNLCEPGQGPPPSLGLVCASSAPVTPVTQDPWVWICPSISRPDRGLQGFPSPTPVPFPASLVDGHPGAAWTPQEPERTLSPRQATPTLLSSDWATWAPSPQS